MNTTGYTASRGRFCHSAMPSMTRSVIAVIRSLDTSAPYTSARCAQISPCVRPLADKEITRSSPPPSRRLLFVDRPGLHRHHRLVHDRPRGLALLSRHGTHNDVLLVGVTPFSRLCRTFGGDGG